MFGNRLVDLGFWNPDLLIRIGDELPHRIKIRFATRQSHELVQPWEPYDPVVYDFLPLQVSMLKGQDLTDLSVSTPSSGK
jgi:hypothetical protein